ncbi:hypothetical protein [uncultured Croceitalea sp.]|uniref:hypothetical protein n=1 Tax=uncultured Croceitalea sp. TaxID=1798908 RepID=UPI00330680CC
MTDSILNEPIFNIDYNSWRLLKNPETGLLIEPVPIEDFDKFEYWSDEFNQPVRQVISINDRPSYADYLDVKTGLLHRRVALLLGCSAYDDEISKEQYEELCQTVLLKHHYQKQINYELLLPYQSLALSFFEFEGRLLINKVHSLFELNCEKQMVEKTILSLDDMISKAKKLSEHEFYHAAIRVLIEKKGKGFLTNDV